MNFAKTLDGQTYSCIKNLCLFCTSKNFVQIYQNLYGLLPFYQRQKEVSHQCNSLDGHIEYFRDKYIKVARIENVLSSL